MSSIPTANGPLPATVEDEDENTQKLVPGSKKTANVKAKGSDEPRKTKRDAASDSGYSSLTATTRGSSSQGSKDGAASKGPLTRLKRFATGKSSAKEQVPASKSISKKPAEKPQRRNSIVNTTAQRPAEDHKLHSPAKPRPIAQAPAQPRPIPFTPYLRTAARPASYHGGIALTSQPVIYTTNPVFHYQQPPPPPPPPLAPPSSLPSVVYSPIEQPSPTGYPPTYQTYSSTRQTPYPFQRTFPQPQPPSPQWAQPEVFYHSQPSGFTPSHVLPSRRNSMHARTVVDYPVVPRHPRQYEYAEPISYRQPRPSPDVVSWVPSSVFDEAIDMDDEIFYRERDRERMPPPPVPQRPPQRPPFHHSATTSAAIQRPKRRSLELHSYSPKKHSFEDARPAPRPLARSRESITKRSGHEAGTSKPPVALRRRPESINSYHELTDPVQNAEDHMARQKSQEQQLPLTADAVRQVDTRNQLTKTRTTRSKGGSEAGSRASSSRDGGEAKRRDYHNNMATHTRKGIKLHIKTSEPLSIDMGTDTIQLRHGHVGQESAEISVGGSQRSQYREPRYHEGRSRDSRRSEKSYRPHSVNSRRDDGRYEIRRLKEHGESGATSRRRSSSRSVIPRREPDEPIEALTQKLKRLGDQLQPQKYETAVEDEKEEPKSQNVDLAPMERVQKLRTGGQSRRSSRSVTTRRAMASGATGSP